MKPTDFSYHLTEYLSKYLPMQAGVSPNTIYSYRDTFSLLLRFCSNERNLAPEKICIKTLDRELISTYMEWIELVRGCSISTRNQRLAAIHAFFRYLQIEAPECIHQCQQVLSVPYKKAPKASVNYLMLEAVKAILAKPDNSSFSGRRDLALLCLMYDSGARVQEIADLLVCDVRLQEPATVKLTGKGNKCRIVPIMSQTAKLLKVYVEERKLMSPTLQMHPFFYNRMNSKLTRAGISYILEKYVVAARESNPGIIPDVITPHCIRHSKAMHLLQSNVNLIYIRDLLGHVDIKTTEVYARADATAKRKALEDADPNVCAGKIPSWHSDENLLSWLKSLGK